MKLRVLVLASAIGMYSVSGIPAAPLTSDAKSVSGPTIVAQAKSIGELLQIVKTGAKNALPESIYKEFEKEALSKLDLDFIKGIDTKKPIAVYGNLDAGLKDGDFAKSSVVFLVPVSDEKDFIALLEKIQLRAEKKDDGYTITIPNAPVEATLRFAKGYAYISVGAKLDPKQLPEPSFIIDAKEMAALALKIRMDQVPAELREAALQFFSQAADEAGAAPAPPAMKELVQDIAKWGLKWTKLGLNEGKELTYRIDLDPKNAVFVTEWTIEGKANSGLSKSIAALKPTKNDFTGIIGSDSAASVLVQTPLFIDDLQDILTKVIDLAEASSLKDVSDKAPKEFVDFMKETFKAATRTVKSGTLDGAASLRGPDKDGLFSVVGAFSVRDTAPLEKVIKSAIKSLPPKMKLADRVAVDAFKIDGVNVHVIQTAEDWSADEQKIFGKANIYVALAPEAVFVTIGVQGKELITEVLGKKHLPKASPLIQAEASGKRLAALFKNMGAPTDGPFGDFLKKFGQMEKIPFLAMKTEGGNKLVIRQEINILPIIWLSGARTMSGPRAVPRAIEKKS